MPAPAPATGAARRSCDDPAPVDGRAVAPVMLPAALGLLGAAALLGAGLAVVYLKGPQAKPPPAAVLAGHAALGAASLVALLAAIGGGVPPGRMGTAGFVPTAAALLALTLALGMLLALASWRRRRPSEMLVGTHATLAIAGLIVLLAAVALR
jgi:hypothetical protein